MSGKRATRASSPALRVVASTLTSFWYSVKRRRVPENRKRMSSGEPARELPVVEQLLGDPLRLVLDRFAVHRRIGRRPVRGRYGGLPGGRSPREEFPAEATLDSVVLDLLRTKRALLHRPDL